MNLQFMLFVNRRQEPALRKAMLLMKVAPSEYSSMMKPLPSVWFWPSMFSSETMPSMVLEPAPPFASEGVMPLDHDATVLLRLWATMQFLTLIPDGANKVMPVRP